MSVRADAENLRLIPIFQNCDPVPLQVMAFASERQTFHSGDVIISEGKKAKSAFFIMSGKVRLSKGGRELGMGEEGSMLGETAMIGGSVYSLTATAEHSVTCAKIEHALFLRVISEYPEFGRAVTEALSRKLGISVQELERVRGLFNSAKSFSGLG
jgi:CRP-like cAMP-binding protein